MEPANSYYDSVHVHNAITEEQRINRKKVFWGLGLNYWKQIIDQDCHKYGKDVFDTGLHAGDIEPGFLEGIKKASMVAAKYLGQITTVEIYQEIHKAACEHLLRNQDLGSLHKRTISADFDLLHYDNYLGFWLSATRPGRYVKNFAQDGFKNVNPLIAQAALNKNLIGKIKAEIPAKMAEWEQQVKDLEAEVAALAQELGLASFMTFEWEDKHKDNIIIYYYPLSKEKTEKAVVYLFDRFNQKAAQIQEELKQTGEKGPYETSIRQAIAELFQHLEWFHPYLDGQGRTDLILLAKLLTDYGLHPAILIRPYDSSVYPFAKWDKLLIQGLKLWEQAQ